MMKRWHFWFILGLSMWWLFLYWEKTRSDHMFCMFLTARGASPFYACDRPWDAVLWKALLPLAVLCGVMALRIVKKARKAQ
jgi:hypothetical protein